MRSRSRLRLFAGLGTLCIALALGACTKEANSKKIKKSDTARSPVAPTEAEFKAVAKVQPAAPEKATAVAVERDKPAPVAQPPKPGAARVVPKNTAVPAGQKVLGDKSYSLTVSAPDSVAPGGEGVVEVTVVPKQGWKMNKEFPTKLKVTAPDGVTVAKPSQSIDDAARFDDNQARFAVSFKADSAGPKSFVAKFKFAVCTEATCDPKKQELAWVVDVK